MTTMVLVVPSSTAPPRGSPGFPGCVDKVSCVRSTTTHTLVLSSRGRLGPRMALPAPRSTCSNGNPGKAFCKKPNLAWSALLVGLIVRAVRYGTVKSQESKRAKWGFQIPRPGGWSAAFPNRHDGMELASFRDLPYSFL